LHAVGETLAAEADRVGEEHLRPDAALVRHLPDADARAITTPTLVFRSGESDVHHTRETSERLAALMPTATVGGAAVG
jgi:hypothetical protein